MNHCVDGLSRRNDDASHVANVIDYVANDLFRVVSDMTDIVELYE